MSPSRVPLLVALLALAPAAAGLAPLVDEPPWLAWTTETVDARWIGTHPIGIAVDAMGARHTGYTVRGETLEVWYARESLTGWVTEKVDTASNSQDVAIDSDGSVLIVHTGNVLTGNSEPVLRLSTRTSTGWTTETFNPNNKYLQRAVLAFGPEDELHIAALQGSEVYHLQRDTSGAWTTELASSGGAFDLSMVVDAFGRVHIVYEDGWDSGSGSFAHVVRNAEGVWLPPTQVAGCDRYPSIALDRPDGVSLHLACHSESVGLVYGHFDGIAWTTQVLRGPSKIGWRGVHLDVDAAGRPHIVYQNRGNAFWQEDPFNRVTPEYAVKTSLGWHFETIDALSNWNGHAPAIAIGPDDRPAVAYVFAAHVGGAFGTTYGTLGQDFVYNLVAAEPVVGVPG